MKDLLLIPRRIRSAASVSTARARLSIVEVACLLFLALPPAPSHAASVHRKAFKAGQKAAAELNWDWAVVHFQRAVDLKPGSREYRNALDEAKRQASYGHFELAKRQLHAGNLEAAISELQQTVSLNPAHQYAYVELEQALEDWRAQRQAEEDEITAFAQAKREAVRSQHGVPKLDPSANIPIIWDMEDTTLKDVFKVIQDVANINIIFDESVRLDDKLSFVTDNVTLEEALDMLMLQQGLTYKVYNDHTILVYPDSPSKRRDYEDQVIQTFYLSNAEVKDVNALLRQVLEVRKTAVNDVLNAITIRDTQDRLAIAGRLIERNDKAKAELIIDLEILEVNRSKMKQWGIDIITPGTADGISSTVAFDDDQIRLNNLRRLNQLGSYVLSPLPSAVISLIRSDADTRTLSRPQARVTDGEKVTVHIGDQVPIPNTTFNTSNTVGGNIVPVTSFTYQNVGIQISLEPRVHHNREITLKMQTEISSVGAVSQGGQPTIGTREIDTVIRLRDGETNLLAGLFQDTTSTSDSGIPGLTEIPILRRIFGSHARSNSETEIILTVTPHIIRIPDISREDLEAMHVGTDRNMTLRGFSKYGVGGSPFRSEEEIPEPTVFERLRPGGQARDTNTLTVPDLELATGSEPGEATSPAETGGDGPSSAPSPEDERSELPLPPAEGVSIGGSGDPEPAQEPQGEVTEPDPEAPAPEPREEAAGSPGTAAAGPVQLAVAGPSQVRAGDSFTLEVRVDARGHELADTPFHLIFPSDRLEVVNVAEGTFFDAAGVQSVFLPSVQPGRLIVGLSLLSRGIAPSGAGTLVTITARALAAGQARIEFDSTHFSDRTRAAIPVRPLALDVRITP